MEFGLSRAIQLASSSLAGRRPARDLVVDELRTGLRPGSSCSNLSATGQKPGLQPARELDSAMEFGRNRDIYSLLNTTVAQLYDLWWVMRYGWSVMTRPMCNRKFYLCSLYRNYLVHAHFILAWKNLIARLEILEPLLAYSFLGKLYVVENCDAEHLINTVDNRRV